MIRVLVGGVHMYVLSLVMRGKKSVLKPKERLIKYVAEKPIGICIESLSLSS
jgi:hypothetical protein